MNEWTEQQWFRFYLWLLTWGLATLTLMALSGCAVGPTPTASQKPLRAAQVDSDGVFIAPPGPPMIVIKPLPGHQYAYPLPWDQMKCCAVPQSEVVGDGPVMVPDGSAVIHDPWKYGHPDTLEDTL